MPAPVPLLPFFLGQLLERFPKCRIIVGNWSHSRCLWLAPAMPELARNTAQVPALSEAPAVAQVGSTCLGNARTLRLGLVSRPDRATVLFLTSPLPETTEAATLCKSIWTSPSFGKSSHRALISEHGHHPHVAMAGEAPLPRLSSGKEVLESFPQCPQRPVGELRPNGVLCRSDRKGKQASRPANSMVLPWQVLNLAEADQRRI